MGNASGHEPLYKNGKPYKVSVSQKKEDVRVGGSVPITNKANLKVNLFRKCIGGIFWAAFLGKKG